MIRPTRRAVLCGALAAAFGLTCGPDAVAALALNFQFNSKEYRGKGFPGWCCSYIVFRNEKKRRPLFTYGWGSAGTLTLTFDNEGGMLEEYRFTSKGSGAIDLSNYSATRALDWNDFACGEWVKQDPHPKITVAILKIKKLTKEDKLLKTFLNPNRGMVTGKALEKLKPRFTLVADFELKVGERAIVVKDVSVKMGFSDHTKYWSAKFHANFKFNGADLGLTGDDAGEIAVKWTSQSFTDLPKQHKAPGVGGGTDIDDLGLDD